MADWSIAGERSENPSIEVVSEIMRAQGHNETADAFEKAIKIQDEICHTVQQAERLHMLGLDKTAREIIDNFQASRGIKICDLSSRNGIPDYVWIEQTHTKGGTLPDGTSEYFEPTDEETMRYTVQSLLPYLERLTPSAPIPKIPVRQALLGRCNTREELKVKKAARLCKLPLNAFVTKATLYLARFINRHRWNEQLHPYYPGEAYLFMEQGAMMQDAFTPDEVQQAMEKVGISGSRIAVDLMAELERLRDARMKPEAGSMDIPE